MKPFVANIQAVERLQVSEILCFVEDNSADPINWPRTYILLEGLVSFDTIRLKLARQAYHVSGKKSLLKLQSIGLVIPPRQRVCSDKRSRRSLL
mmetsp:Transcript_54655/g.144420  ORF Transcript_54655/g.144420 Transcript_54655/m.144420 type:complete len:94 (+) Transcript_54655:100-381(+)